MKQSRIDFDLSDRDNKIVMPPLPPIKIVRNYLNQAQQKALLHEALLYPFERPSIVVFGKSVTIPRSQVWFGDAGCDYCFSSLLITAQSWPHYANKLRFKLARDFGEVANGVLVNHYENGQQSVGWHSDNEPEIVANSLILSISLGASRDFVLRHNESQHKVKLELNSGDLLVMSPPMQQQWQHCLPKRTQVSEPRINFTFRHLIKDFHK
ncbi:MAG: alpha-ketoglutarate-dependent dioxygenase AlkB [Gammaproteobacteria bacterium]|nr:alpha-ketoglutarate-dependent dioxygenase AlkB [Gammaproteobacteria bacterium]